MYNLEGVIALVGLFLVLPTVVVVGILGSKFLKLKSDELEVRQQELEVQKKKLEFLTAEAQRELTTRLDSD